MRINEDIMENVTIMVVAIAFVFGFLFAYATGVAMKD